MPRTGPDVRRRDGSHIQPVPTQLPVEIIHGHALLFRLDIPSHAPLLDWSQQPSLSDDLYAFPYYQHLFCQQPGAFLCLPTSYEPNRAEVLEI